MHVLTVQRTPPEHIGRAEVRRYSQRSNARGSRAPTITAGGRAKCIRAADDTSNSDA
jgi:hypothetical protein